MIYKYWLYFDLSTFYIFSWNAEYKTYSYTVLENKPKGFFCWNETKSSLSAKSGVACFKMSGYFQFHETNLVDTLHCGDVLSP